MFAKQPRKHQSSQLPPLRGPNQSKSAPVSPATDPARSALRTFCEKLASKSATSNGGSGSDHQMVCLSASF